MQCPKCKNNNVTISMEEISSKIKKKDNSFVQKAGHGIVRGTAGFLTMGISNLFIPKKLEGQEKTKNKLQKFCICQECGYSWKIK